MGNALALRRLLRAPGAYVALCSAALGGLLALAWDLAGTPGGNGRCCNLDQPAFLAAYLGRTDAETATRVRTHAAIHRFLHVYQRLRHPRDSARFEDAQAMLAVWSTSSRKA